MKIPKGLRYAKIGFKRSNHKKPMGAALIKGGKIIITSNEKKTGPFMKDNYPSFFGTHCEAKLFGRMTPDETEGAHVFVYRQKKNSSMPAMARPCNFCYQILVKQKIRRVTYSIEQYPYFATEKICDMKNLKGYDWDSERLTSF